MLKSVLALLQKMGMHLVAYINNILIFAESNEMVLDYAKVRMVYVLECLGFVINKDKLVLILSQTIEFLGLTINTINTELQLPLHKYKSLGGVLKLAGGRNHLG